MAMLHDYRQSSLAPDDMTQPCVEFIKARTIRQSVRGIPLATLSVADFRLWMEGYHCPVSSSSRSFHGFGANIDSVY
jgi:hypothetical protein